MNIYTLSLKDYLTKKMLLLAFFPFFASLLVMYTLYFSAFDAINTNFSDFNYTSSSTSTSVINGVEHTQTVNNSYEGSGGFIDFLKTNSVTSWFIEFVKYTVGIIVIFIVAIFTALFVIGFLTPQIVKEIHKRHYNHIELKSYGNIVTNIFFTMIHLMVTFILLIVMIPLYFIPFINILAFNFPFYYLFHKLMILDVSSSIYTKNDFMKLKYINKSKYRFYTLGLYIISLVPFAVLITPVFNVIVLTHLLFQSKQEQI